MPIADGALVLLVGTSGSGKSTFARDRFQPTQVLSSDSLRGWISDDPSDQTVSKEAFAVLHDLVRYRLALGRTTVVDATNLTVEARGPLLALARAYGQPAVAIVFDIPESVCVARDGDRNGRSVGPAVIRRQRIQFEAALHALPKEGFATVDVVRETTGADTDAHL